MAFLYKTINHEIYVCAIDIENSAFLHGSFKYKDSARRWAVANSNPNKRPLARLVGSKLDNYERLTGVPIYTPITLDNANEKTNAAEEPNYPEPSAEQLEQFYLIHGEGAEWKINPSNGWPMAV